MCICVHRKAITKWLVNMFYLKQPPIPRSRQKLSLRAFKQKKKKALKTYELLTSPVPASEYSTFIDN